MSVRQAFQMGRVSESASRNRRSDWDTLSALRLVRKLCPGIKAWNGMHFPVESLSGKCDPEFTLEVGCAFPTGPQAESASHSGREFWDTVSAAYPIRKTHPTIWPKTGARFPDESRRRPSQTGRLAPLPSPSARACYTSSIYATANGSAPRPPLANEL